jgi:hypothetical protein
MDVPPIVNDVNNMYNIVVRRSREVVTVEKRLGFASPSDTAATVHHHVRDDHRRWYDEDRFAVLPFYVSENILTVSTDRRLNCIYAL